MNTIIEARSAIIERNAEFALETGNKRIVARYRNPSRVYAVQVPAIAWTLTDVPERYRAMLESVLDAAAVSILKQHIDSFSSVPTSMDTAKFSQDALIDAATSSNSAWLSKEELSDLWKASATRQRFYGDSRYASNGAYRKAVAKFEELVLKLSGKSAKIDHDDLDKILVKLDDADLETELGSFIVKRIESMKAKPVIDSVDMDLL